MNILLVEDDAKIAKFITKGLQEEMYQVDCAADGEDGFLFLKLNSYDLVILDLMLPKLGGIELCKKIRKKGITTPVIMLTAKITVKEKVEGLEAGADDYLTKPFAFDELLARVRAIQRRTTIKAADLQYGLLRIDLLAHRVFYNDQEIILRPKELAMLRYLLSNTGRVLSRTRILENAWGYDFDPQTNVVDVYISHLREKLNPFFPAGIIRTVKGMGYMIEDCSDD